MYLNYIQKIYKYCKNRKLPKVLRNKVINYFNYYYKHSSDYNERKILNQLYPDLQKQILVEIYKDFIKICPLLEDNDTYYYYYYLVD